MVLVANCIEDNCFYVERPITKVDDEGREYDAKDEVHVRFNMGRNLQEHTIVMS